MIQEAKTTDAAPIGDAEREKRARRKAEKRGRAKRRLAFMAERSGSYDRRALDEAMARVLAEQPVRGPQRRGGRAKAFPVGDAQRWVPIGPSVVLKGQAVGDPRVTGRIRDLAVSDDGTRAYAASAKGGVWYTADAGATWAPVGGWAERSGIRGGNNAQACGVLLVSFGADAAADHVMVGTGEPVPRLTAASWSSQGGIGVLVGRGPAAAAVVQPWEQDTGTTEFEGKGIYRLARDPAITGAAIGAVGDRVLAATSVGLYLGTRAAIAGPPARDGYTWVHLAALDTFAGGSQVTDVLWIAGGANGRIFAAVDSAGVAWSDDLGVNWQYVTNLDWVNMPDMVTGRMTIARATAERFYVLGEVSKTSPARDVPTLWQVRAALDPNPTAVIVRGVPRRLWPGQRDYDQALAVDPTSATVDRIYLGGSTIQPTSSSNYAASLWCFETDVPAAPLRAVPRISNTAAPPGGAGANRSGLIGNNVHADIHAIRLVGAAGPNRQVWVGCDGGVFVSAQAGRCNTFLARVTGLAALEPAFHAPHPDSSHHVAIGCQDNGTQVRVGDTVWEEILQGDGGGVVFHPRQPSTVIAQYLQGTWLGRPTNAFRDPLHRSAGGRYEPDPGDREFRRSSFYSGAAAIPISATAARIAVGTNRVWFSDNVAAANAWRVIPAVSAPGAAASDPRPGGSDPSNRRTRGVPAGSLGAVTQLRWVTPNDLIALYERGLVRYALDTVTSRWTATTLVPGTPGAPDPAKTVLTDASPVPGTSDFYLTTTGDPADTTADTCFLFESAGPRFVATTLRRVLDQAGPPVVAGPLDPAYAICVDPNNANELYAGTVTGVWRGVRTAGTTNFAWTPFVNGLPQATVQDLSIWADPAAAAGSPRLLRAAVQSRGLWEVDLAAATEPRRTYLRVHAFDDRRRFPTPMVNPRRPSTAPPLVAIASPDVVVRPAARTAPVPAAPAPAPAWQLTGSNKIQAGQGPAYELWTFQTAFRWIYPSIAADGTWSDQLGDLVQLRRSELGLSPGRFIDRNLWNAVVAGTHLDATGAVTAAATDPLAVYRAPWQTAAALDAVASEVDVLELVRPPRAVGDVWWVYREPSTVDVLVHHRDVRPLAARDAFAILLWRSDPSDAVLLATNGADIPAYAASLLTAAPIAIPAGWNVVTAGGTSVHRLPVALDARIPRAIPIDVDLGAAAVNDHVLLLAIAGSNVDALSAAPSGVVGDVTSLVQRWPYAALRLVKVSDRP